MDNAAYSSSENVSNGHGVGMNELPQTKERPALERGFSEPDEETQARREEARNRTPLLYCRWIVARPKTVFGITLGIALGLMFATFAMMALGVDVLPIVFERLPLDIRDNEFYLRGLSWQFRHEDDSVYERGSDEGANQAERSRLREAVILLYEKSGSDVLTPERLKEIKDLEDKLVAIKDYEEKFCFKPGESCLPPRSIIQFFDGTFPVRNSSGQLIETNAVDFPNAKEVIYAAYQGPASRQAMEFYLPSNADINHETQTIEASIIRSSISFGFPLAGYDTIEDDEDEQDDKLAKFFSDNFIDVAQKAYEKGVGDMDFYYMGNVAFQEYVTNQVYRDMALLGGSLLFIFFFMWFQTRSLFITGFAILSIVTSFFIANLLYRFVFDYRYFGIFHVLALFIILGIGADDVFVFYDTWRETAFYKFPSLAHRLSYAYRRAIFAMLWTSLTTAIAFIVSATSPFLGVNTFGVFAGLLVFVNYMSVVVYFPAVIIMYHVYFEKFCCCCCCPNKTAMVENGEVPHHDKKGIVVRFFANYYYKFITHKIIRWIILLCFAAMLAVFVYFVTKLEVQEEQIEFLPRDTNFGGFIAKNQRFGTGDYPQRIFIVWGLKEQDVTDCHRSDSLCFGETVWDDNFKIENEIQQQKLLEFCEKIENLSEQKIKDLHIRTNSVTGKPEVYCFPELMNDFMQVEQNRTLGVNMTRRYPMDAEISFPIDNTTAYTMMRNIDYVFNTSLLPNDFKNLFEVGMETWLHNGFIPGEIQDFTYDTYNPFLGVARKDAIKTTKAFEDGILPYTLHYGSDMKYAAIVVNTTLKPRNLGFLEGQPIRDEWEKFVNDEMHQMPEGLQNGYQCTPIDFTEFDLWHWLDIQEVLVFSAIQGILIGLGCALPILIVATMNVFVGLMATLNIAFITLTVLGFIPMMGWKLGFMESLNLVLVVGLAVDYCVHLAEGYTRSKHMDRKGRLRDALQEVGVSVISGCITSVGASSFMLLAVILFFTQFGSFLFATLAFSFLYSIGFFCTCLGVFGPQNNFGSLMPLVEKIKASCCKSSVSHTPSSPDKYKEQNGNV